MSDKSEETSLEQSHFHPNSLSLTLRSLQQIQNQMSEAIAVLSHKDYDLHLPREINKESISKKIYNIQYYLEKEIENISDLILSLSEDFISEGTPGAE